MIDAPTFLPAGRRPAMAFDSAEALARHLHRLRAGRRIDLLEQSCARDGAPEFPVVAVFAAGAGGADDWLGWTAGPGADRTADVFAALRATRPAAAPVRSADLLNAMKAA